ncbi:hypothetical protein HWV62_7276 [Athelia sp. TMB]|nr:hypothetical protein HWV62_7276 [Athelia sp. TMB]
MSSSLTAVLTGALQGTIAVLLTTYCGYLAASPRFALLDRATVARISRLGSSLFLPALIISSTGPELTMASITRLWIVLVWAVLSSAIAYGLGLAGQRVLGLEHWTILAAGRANSNTLPLLLVDSLASTESKDDRAAELNVRQEIITFAIGPRLLAMDNLKLLRPDTPDDVFRSSALPYQLGLPRSHDDEYLGLLDDYADDEEVIDERMIQDIPNQPVVPTSHAVPAKEAKTLGIEMAKNHAMSIWSTAMAWMNPALVGGVIALILGIVPLLHHAFFAKDGVFTHTITKAAGNLGGLFLLRVTLVHATRDPAPLASSLLDITSPSAISEILRKNTDCMFTLGATLALTKTSLTAKPTIWLLLVRFILMPAISMALVFATAGRGWYDSDGLMLQLTQCPSSRFLFILAPSGPSALLLLSVAQRAGADEGPVAGFLTVAYLCAPLMAFVCSLGMRVVQIVQGR